MKRPRDLFERSEIRRVIHPEYPDYFICSDGTVERRVASKRRDHTPGDILIGTVFAHSGYRQFGLNHRDGGKRVVRSNRLVCEAFHGPPPSDNSQAAHRNGLRSDNREENLYWASPKENMGDQAKHGTKRFGETHHNAKLSEDNVRSIRASYSGIKGEVSALARQFGVDRKCIHYIVTREKWKHVV
jgi:hypothetical protein